MPKTSEYCAVGHPDRTCDYIASFLLDRWLERDPLARVALEVQLKDAFCTVSGEVTSSWRFAASEIAEFCREAVRRIGYTDEYVAAFGEGTCVSGSGLEVTLHISHQSPDIARGVDADGWGDQGIFWGYAENSPETGDMPLDHWLARRIAHEIVARGVGGLDVKTMVTVEDGRAVECVVAVPLAERHDRGAVERIVRAVAGPQCRVTVNGTGVYVTHGSVGDCGTTGRKLAVDFYGGNCRVGGGSPWGKDPTKADVALNVLARRMALDYMREHGLESVTCGISCRIGSPEIRVSFLDGGNRLLETRTESAPPSHVIEALGLRRPRYAERCAAGLFGFERR